MEFVMKIEARNGKFYFGTNSLKELAPNLVLNEELGWVYTLYREQNGDKVEF